MVHTLEITVRVYAFWYALHLALGVCCMVQGEELSQQTSIKMLPI